MLRISLGDFPSPGLDSPPDAGHGAQRGCRCEQVFFVNAVSAFRPPTTSWSVGLLTGSSLGRLTTPAGIVNPIISEHELATCGGTMAADPFAILVDGVWNLFFEMTTRTSPNAVIGCATSGDLRNWQIVGTVLEEDHHLSYPFVFEHEGDIFMMPESKRARSITIYRAVEFPQRWQPVRAILRGRYFDASMVRYEGRYWLFVGWLSYSLRIFHADHPLGPWRPHAWTCIRCYASGAARPGGRPHVFDGKLVRFAQDNASHYGHRLRAWHVTKISRWWYEEEPLIPGPVLEPAGTGWNGRCMHHIDPHRRGDGSIVAFVDGCP